MQVVVDDSSLLVAEDFLSGVSERITPKMVKEIADGLNTLLGRPLLHLNIMLSEELPLHVGDGFAVIYLDEAESGTLSAYKARSCVIYKQEVPLVSDGRRKAVAFFS